MYVYFFCVCVYVSMFSDRVILFVSGHTEILIYHYFSLENSKITKSYGKAIFLDVAHLYQNVICLEPDLKRLNVL